MYWHRILTPIINNCKLHSFEIVFLCVQLSLQGVDLTVQVLTTGCWPTQASTPTCSLPTSPSAAFDVFKK